VVNARWAKPGLADAESLAFAAQQVARGDTHPGEQDLAVGRNGVAPTEDGEVAQHGHAWRIAGHDDDAVAPGARGIRAGDAHDEQETALRMVGARGEPFVAVNDVAVAVAADAGCDVAGVGGGDVRLGHGEGGVELGAEQRVQPAAPLLRRAEAKQHLHVGNIGRVAVEDLGTERVNDFDTAGFGI